MKNYNHFTIDYITTIITALDIEMSNSGEALIFPERISTLKLATLKENLGSLWKDSQSAIDICKNKHDAKIQSGLFGLVNDFNKAMQIGFLISDRVVLIDYLFDRLLGSSNLTRVNIPHLCTVASELASLLPLAERGRVVIIPSPFSWNDESKQLIRACIENSNEIFTPYMMALVNLFSITRICNLHPYTITETDVNYSEITSVNIVAGKILSKQNLDYAQKGLLGALFTEKSLMREGFVTSSNIPLSKFQEIIHTNTEFNNEFLNKIVSGGEIELATISAKLENSILEEIENTDKNKIKKLIPASVALASGSSYGMAYFCATSPTLTAFAAILGFSSTAMSLLIGNNKNNDRVIQVFSELKKNGL